MEEIWEEPPCCGFCAAVSAAMGMGPDAVCYGHYWHPLASDMVPICDECIAFFEETSIDAAGELVVASAPCQQCGEAVEQTLMYWVMHRGGRWLCAACVAAWWEERPETWMSPLPLPVSVPVDETWVRQTLTYHDVSIRTFQQRDDRTMMFVLADLCRALGMPSVDEVCAWLHEDMLEMVWVADEQEPLLLVTELGLYQLLMACYRQTRNDEVMRFVHWLWWEAPIGEGKP
jgi:hypothetical protein